MTAGHCSQERRSVRLLWASGRHIFINWSIYKCVLCVFLFKGTLFDTYCRFIHIERTVNSTVTHAYAKMNTCIFSMKHISLLVLWNTGRHASTTCGGHLNNEIAKKSIKMQKTGRLFTVWELQEAAARRPLVQPRVRTCVSGDSDCSPLCARPWTTSKVWVSTLGYK